jgi:hypothetical protein
LVLGADEMFTLTPAERHVIDQATYVLVSECLADQGFEYRAQAPGVPDSGPPARLPEWDSAMGLIRPASAAFGYMGDPALKSDAGVDGDASVGVSVDLAGGQEYVDALMGCLGTVSEELSGGQVGDEKTPWTVKRDAEADAAASPAFTAAVTAWSACMARQGYDYDGPVEAQLDEAWAWSECPEGEGEGAGGEACANPTRPALAEAEIATARADVACKAEVDMVAVYRAELWRAQESRIEANRPALAAALAFDRRRVERAQEILAGLE